MGRRFSILVYEWVTGGGMRGLDRPVSWVEEGRAMREALAADFASARVCGVSPRVVTTLDERETGKARQASGIESLVTGSDHLATLCRDFDCIVAVAPETNGTLESVARIAMKFGGRWLGSSPEAIALATDKLRLARHWQERGILTPPTELVSTSGTRADDFTYPVVLKPIDGAGALDTYLIERPSSHGAQIAPSARMIVQPWIAGTPMSASVLIDAGGRAHLLALGRQRMAVENSAMAYRGGVLPVVFPEAEAPIREAVECVPGLHGFVGVDFIRDERNDRVWLLEINPRPTTSYAGLVRVLPPGLLATAWLAAAGIEGSDLAALDKVQRSAALSAPIAFDCSGLAAPSLRIQHP